MKKIMLIILFIISILCYRDSYKLVWHDEFSGLKLDNSRWNTEWAWRGSAFNTDEAIKINNGNLEICPFTKNRIHYTGFITTHGKFEFKNGIIEIRVKFNTKQAEWCDLWLTNDDILWGKNNSDSEEIDVFEHRFCDKNGGDISNGVNCNIYYPSYGENMKYVTRRMGGIVDDKFHIFKLIRENRRCEFLCDGKTILEAADPRPDCSLYMILSVELDDGNWAGNAAEYYDGSPAMTVDYVRVYKKD